jgi:hypothetical protein
MDLGHPLITWKRGSVGCHIALLDPGILYGERMISSRGLQSHFDIHTYM